MFRKALLVAAWLLLASNICRADLQEILVAITESTKTGKVDRAMDLANQGIALYPDAELLYFMRGQIFEHRRLFDDAIKDYTKVLAIKSGYFRAYQRRGECHFKAGHFKASIEDFDKYILVEPKRELEHWQRGISCYYAGEYSKGVRQFELHKEVNPDDAENAIWHYACNVKASGLERAKKALILVRDDGRPWAMAAHDLFRGLRSSDEVLVAAEKGETNEELKRDNLFHSHFYIALNYEINGNADKALEHLQIAVEKYPRKHYRGDVARVHLGLLKKKAEDQGKPKATDEKK